MQCNKLKEHPINYLVQAIDKWKKNEPLRTSTRGHAIYILEGRSISTPSYKILVVFNTYNRYQREGSNYQQNGSKQLSQETSTYEP